MDFIIINERLNDIENKLDSQIIALRSICSGMDGLTAQHFTKALAVLESTSKDLFLLRQDILDAEEDI